MTAMRQEGCRGPQDVCDTTRLRSLDTYRHWSAAEEAVVRDGYRRIPAAELAARLGRGVGAIKMRARLLGVAKPVQARIPWTAAADARLRAGYGSTPTSELAAALGTTVEAVWARAKALGLKRQAAIAGRQASAQAEIARLRAENDHLKHGALDAAHAPTADARRLAVLMAYRMQVIDATEAAVVLGVMPERLPVELGKAAKLGLDVVVDALKEGR